jgi:thioredoxin-related protein
MKKNIFFFLILFCKIGTAQLNDSITAPYLQDKKLPFFKIMLTDSSSFYKSNLKRKHSTLIVFFSPDCEHCKKFTELLLTKTGDFKKTQIIMVSALPLNFIKDFYTRYQIEKYPSIIMGKDALYFFATYYQAHYMPFVAAYNKKGELIKGWDGGTRIDEIVEAMK